MNGIGDDRSGFASASACLRGLFLGIFVLLLCAGFSRPDLDDRHPGLKAPVAAGKLLKPQKNPFDLDDLRRQRGILTFGNIPFTSLFGRTLVRFDRKQNPHLWPVITLGCQRSPPFSL